MYVRVFLFYLFYVCELVIAESMGALNAIEFCRDLGLQDIILEGDAESAVKVINNKNHKWCRYWQILEDIKRILVG